MKESVVIAGGGVAAMEAALALQDLAGDRVEGGQLMRAGHRDDDLA